LTGVHCLTKIFLDVSQNLSSLPFFRKHSNEVSSAFIASGQTQNQSSAHFFAWTFSVASTGGFSLKNEQNLEGVTQFRAIVGQFIVFQALADSSLFSLDNLLVHLLDDI
jgi:hypothetical protein